MIIVSFIAIVIIVIVPPFISARICMLLNTVTITHQVKCSPVTMKLPWMLTPAR